MPLDGRHVSDVQSAMVEVSLTTPDYSVATNPSQRKTLFLGLRFAKSVNAPYAVGLS